MDIAMFSTSIPAKQIILRLKPAAGQGELSTRHVHGTTPRLKDVCHLLGIAATTSIEQDPARFPTVRCQPGQVLYQAGDAFDMLYVVRSGCLKTLAIDGTGQEQVLGFAMRGELIGIDGIYPEEHPTAAVALTNCELIGLPFRQLAALGKIHIGLDSALYSLMSESLVKEQSLLHMLALVGAEARVAQFLVWMSRRFAELGYSGKNFTLPMTRDDIGNYLGLTLETVSRALSSFKRMGWIALNRRHVELCDINALEQLRRPKMDQA